MERLPLLAVYLQILGKRELTEAELGVLMQRLPAIAHLQKLDFGGRSLLNRNSNREYRFSHYSIQEFLVAKAVCDQVLLDDVDLCPEPACNGKPKLTVQMLEFLNANSTGEALGERLTRLDYQDLGLTKLLELASKRVLKPELFPRLVCKSALKTGESGPEMMILPAGVLYIGEKGEVGKENGGSPRPRVVIDRPIAMGRYPVTFDDYDRFCTSTGRAKPNDSGWGRGNRPVIDVSWDDAQAYCAWLSAQTGQAYRLPSEAEWEYAARAGTDTAYWWGDDIGVNRANCLGSASLWSGKQTSPVGSFPANPVGLYDTAGNVWEWVQDRWHDNYQGAPKDGSAWESGGVLDFRVCRGGSWDNHAGNVRCAFRVSIRPFYRLYDLGFRLALGSPC